MVLAVVVVIVIVVGLVATNPMMRKREDAAIKTLKDHLGAGSVQVIEPRTTAMGTEPDDGSGLRGMVCLGLSDAELMAVAWVRGGEWRIPRASVTSVDTPVEDPSETPRATIVVGYTRADGEEMTAMFRVREAPEWLTALGYDWGPDGPPPTYDD